MSQSLEPRPLPLFSPEHSISTSVPSGRDLTQTQVRTYDDEHPHGSRQL
jgi:hypothetical protein